MPLRRMHQLVLDRGERDSGVSAYCAFASGVGDELADSSLMHACILPLLWRSCQCG
jgi:hypothetical protein